MRAFLAFALLLCACPAPSPVPTPARRFGDMAPLYPTCIIPDGGALPSYRDVCADVVTKDNRACVKCPSAHGCWDRVDSVYCVVGADCKDPMCKPDDGQ